MLHYKYTEVGVTPGKDSILVLVCLFPFLSIWVAELFQVLSQVNQLFNKITEQKSSILL